MGLYIGLIIVGVLLLFLIITYNSLINSKNQVENAFGGMDVQLKKRYDLIPNLISSVKTYMKHEADTLTEITELRAKAISGDLSDDEKIDLLTKDPNAKKYIKRFMGAKEFLYDIKQNTYKKTIVHR